MGGGRDYPFRLIAVRLGKRGATVESSSAEPAGGAKPEEPESDDEGLDDLTSADSDQAANSAPAAPAVTPAPPAPICDFIGRESPARALHELLENGESALIIPEGGRKGLGATELALSVASGLEHVYPDGRIAPSVRRRQITEPKPLFDRLHRLAVDFGPRIDEVIQRIALSIIIER